MQQPSVQTADATPTPVDIESLLKSMTLAEKIGQMTQVEKGSINPEAVTEYHIGSVLSGGGGNPEPNTAENWAAMVRSYQEAALKTRLAIPLIYGSDAVHGHNNVYGATIYPHNIGLGAARDADLVRRIARATARELIATNAHFNFAPAVSVPRDIRWGRTFEGFSEDTGLVTELSTAAVQGLQDDDPRVLASIKHFAGDGGTTWGTTPKLEWLQGSWQAPGDQYKSDQGDTRISEAEFRELYLRPYQAAIAAGAQNVMVSLSSWNGLKMHAHHYMLTEVLKGEFGFEGFVITDWMGISQLDPDYGVCVAKGINAGIDMVMVPYDYKRFIEMLTTAVEAGIVPMERIDDAVRRILRVKAWLGLFEQPFGREDLLSEIGSAAHRTLAREAVQKSVVLLKNEEGALPFPKEVPVLVAGVGANDIGMQCGGWTIDWQGKMGASTIGTTILEGLRQISGDSEKIQYDPEGKFDEGVTCTYGVVVIGETPYAEGMGDKGDLSISEVDRLVIERMRVHCAKLVVILLSGRPMILTDVLDLADAWVAAWLPGTEAHGIADVLFGDVPFTGRLSYSFPRSAEQIPLKALLESPDGALFPFGHAAH